MRLRTINYETRKKLSLPLKYIHNGHKIKYQDDKYIYYY